MFAEQLQRFERLFIVDTSKISDQTAELLVYIKYKINAMFVAMIGASLTTIIVNVYFWCQERDQIMLASKLLTDYYSTGKLHPKECIEVTAICEYLSYSKSLRTVFHSIVLRQLK